MTRQKRRRGVFRVRTKGNKSGAAASRLLPRLDGREFPDYPRVGVGGVVIDQGQVLLVRRGREPLKGHWSLPGGLVENGEELALALRRELKEETGLSVEPIEVIGVFERIERVAKARQRVRYHYVIVDYICRLRGAERRRPQPPAPHPATDITAAEWAKVEHLKRYGLTAQAEEVILRALSFVDEQG